MESYLKSTYMPGGSHLQSPIITITVGVDSDKQTFFVHQTLLEDCSGHFKNALGDHSADGQQPTFDYPDEDADVIDAFLRHVYNPHEPSIEYLDLKCEAYVFGAKIQADTFKTKILSEITKALNVDHFEKGIDIDELLDLVQIIYAGTEKDDPARLVLAHFYAAMLGKDKCGVCGMSDCIELELPVYDADETTFMAENAPEEFRDDVMAAPYASE